MDHRIRGSASQYGDLTRAEILKSLDVEKDKLSRKMNAMHVKLLHQRDIHTKCVRTFAEDIGVMVKNFSESAVKELETSVGDRVSQLEKIQKKWADEGVTLRKLKEKLSLGSTVSLAEVQHRLEEMDKFDQLVKSLNMYEVKLTPELAAVYEYLQHDTKQIYVQTSPLDPKEIVLQTRAKVSYLMASCVITVTVVPVRRESGLPHMLTATLEKMAPVGGAQAAAADVKTMGAVDAIIGDNGAVKIRFSMPLIEMEDGGGEYVVSVLIYGRDVTNSPLQLWISTQEPYQSGSVDVRNVGNVYSSLLNEPSSQQTDLISTIPALPQNTSFWSAMPRGNPMGPVSAGGRAVSSAKFANIRMPKGISTVQTVFSVAERMKMDETIPHNSSSPYAVTSTCLPSANPHGIFGDDDN